MGPGDGTERVSLGLAFDNFGSLTRLSDRTYVDLTAGTLGDIPITVAELTNGSYEYIKSSGMVCRGCYSCATRHIGSLCDVAHYLERPGHHFVKYVEVEFNAAGLAGCA